MKCKYCGGDVTLDDHFCPHCGRPVDQSQRHHQEMKQYETEFEERHLSGLIPTMQRSAGLQKMSGNILRNTKRTSTLFWQTGTIWRWIPLSVCTISMTINSSGNIRRSSVQWVIIRGSIRDCSSSPFRTEIRTICTPCRRSAEITMISMKL